MAGILLNEVAKSFRKGAHAVRNLSLDIADGELFVLVGASGCGKTTTLRMIAGLEKPDLGSIHLGSKDVTRWPPRRRRVSLIFQEFSLYPHLTTGRNLAFAMQTRRIPRNDRAALREEAVELTGIGDLLDRRPDELSGGERQRVALAASIVRRPSCHLLDEPLSDLDQQSRRALRADLRRLQQRLGATMLLVTHDQEEAMSLADRMAIMHAGKVRQVGTPHEVYRAPADRFVAGFLGSPAMNLIDGHLLTENGSVSFKDGHGVDLPPPSAVAERIGQPRSRAVVYGVRPEHLLWSTSNPKQTGRIEVEIHQVESLGERVDIHGRLDSGEIVIGRADPDAPPPKVGERITLQFDLTRAHLFEADEKGKRISDGVGNVDS